MCIHAQTESPSVGTTDASYSGSFGEETSWLIFFMVCTNSSGKYQDISSNQATTAFFHIFSMSYFLINLSQNMVILFVTLETCTQEVRAFKLDQVSDYIVKWFSFLSPVPTRKYRHITPNCSKTLPPTLGLRTDRYIILCYRPVVWHLENRASWYILIIKPNRCTNFSNLFSE